MELTPPATHSPASPFRYQHAAPSQAQAPQHPHQHQHAHQHHSQTSAPAPPPPAGPSSVYEYPSPAQSDSRYRSESTSQGLALYPCSMPEPSSEHAGDAALQTPESQHWNGHSVPERQTSHATPNILSAEYDPFAPYHPTVAAPYTHHDVYAHPQPAAASPLASSIASQRSSMSSAPASDIFTQPSSVSSYTPRMDLEPKHADYHSHPDGIIMQSPQESHAMLHGPGGPYTGSIDASFYPEPSPMTAWHGHQADLPPFSTLVPAFRRASAQEPLPSTPESHHTIVRRATTSVPRTRQPRRLTTKEDANFQCQVKGCGKLFGRSYNFKAHMETHDTNRDYPFPCPLKDCNKKFVRKTDLQRHHQSVHMKQRNFRCDYCSRFFARKDTLRRHMEDGCSKRFDIETVDFRPAAYPADPQAGPMRVMTHPSEQQRSASFASVQYSPAQHAGAVPMPSPYMDRPPYMTDAHPEQVWSH